MGHFDVDKKPGGSTFPAMAKNIKKHEGKEKAKISGEDVLNAWNRKVANLFNSPKGMEVLDILEAQYAGRLLSHDPNITQANAARREIFDSIRTSIKRTEEE